MRIYKTLMNKTFICLLIVVLVACKSTPYSDETTKSDLRAPAYPLLTLHPHMKLWSMTDELNKQNMTFGGSTQLPFVGFLRVDGAIRKTRKIIINKSLILIAFLFNLAAVLGRQLNFLLYVLCMSLYFLL